MQVLDQPPPLLAVFVVQLVADLALAVLGAVEQLTARSGRPAADGTSPPRSKMQ